MDDQYFASRTNNKKLNNNKNKFWSTDPHLNLFYNIYIELKIMFKILEVFYFSVYISLHILNRR